MLTAAWEAAQCLRKSTREKYRTARWMNVELSASTSQILTEEIRFSWWPNGKFVPKALDVTESHLLDLMESAIKEGVFTQDFLTGLRKLLDSK
jgi:hypothetical protein